MSQIGAARVLVTLLGIEPGETSFELDGRCLTARLAPVALARLLPEDERPDRVIALCTDEAGRKTWPILDEELPSSIERQRIDIGPLEDSAPRGSLLEALLDAVAETEPARLILDLTHGPRHLALTTLVSCLVFARLRGTELGGPFYASLSDSATTPLINLKHLLDVSDWLHAITTFSQTASARPIAHLVERSHLPDQRKDWLRRLLEEVDTAYAAGLPLEVGRAAERFLHEGSRTVLKALERDLQLPLAQAVVRELQVHLRPFHLEASGDGWKKSVRLTEQELDRQAALIRHLIRTHHLASAIGLMSEWVISWALLGEFPGLPWLDYHKARRRAQAALGTLSKLADRPEISLQPAQKELARFVKDLADLRNGFHHHGMRPMVLGFGDNEFKTRWDRTCDYWERVLSLCPSIPLSVADPTTGCLLITPQGRKPGVAFSALRAVSRECGRLPDTCFVVTSKETSASVDEAARRAGYSGRIERIEIHDPHGGVGELDTLRKQWGSRLAGASEVYANMTGGTTLMGLACDQLAQEALRLCRPTRRFGLIDRRATNEQADDPYVEAEAYWIDPPEGEDDHGW